MSHFCRVVCNAIGLRESGVCIAFVLGIIVTTPDVHVSGMVPALRKRFSDSCICGWKISENLLKNFAEKPSSPGALLLFNLLERISMLVLSRCAFSYTRTFFFYQMGQFIMCQGPLWAKFNAEYRFRQSQGVHTGCSS